MATYKVVYRSDAASDIDEIYLWVYEASRDLAIAERFINRILASCERLGTMPRSGKARDDLYPGLRTVAFERKAVIAYLIDEDTVEILNIFYGRRDFEAFYR